MTSDLLSSRSYCSFPTPSTSWMPSFPSSNRLRDFEGRSYDSLLISHLRSAIPTARSTSSACFIDARVPGIDTLKLRKPALGDVDYHPHPDFIDVGRVRQWCLDCPASEIAGD
jgi:hypothetical protein